MAAGSNRGVAARAGSAAGAALSTVRALRAHGRDPATRMRMGAALWSGIRTTFVSIWRVAAILWLQITGLFFVIFFVMGTAAAVHEYRLWALGRAPVARFALAAAFSAVFGWFAATSFWRAARR
jgi:hypothetical protein